MKQSKTSAILLGVVVIFAVFCLGVFIGKSGSSDGFRIVTERTEQTVLQAAQQSVENATAPMRAKPTETQEQTEPTTQANPFPININTAGVQELMQLPNIGATLAQRIVDYRAQYGAFKTVQELDMVDGIGAKTLDAILELITVEE